MNERMIQLAERREHLIALAATQRTALARNIEPWRMPLALADQGLAALRYIKNHPAWLIGGVALFAVVRPKGLGKWMRRGWVAWRIMRKLGRKQPGT